MASVSRQSNLHWSIRFIFYNNKNSEGDDDNDNYDGNDDGNDVAFGSCSISPHTAGFPAKWRLRSKRRHSILMTCHYPDLGSASDWLKQISLAARPIRSTTQIWLVTRHQYGISALVPETSFRRETSSGVAKCRRFLRLLTMMILLMMTIITRCWWW